MFGRGDAHVQVNAEVTINVNDAQREVCVRLDIGDRVIALTVGLNLMRAVVRRFDMGRRHSRAVVRPIDVAGDGGRAEDGDVDVAGRLAQPYGGRRRTAHAGAGILRADGL